MNKRGSGFRFPSYILPNDIMGELIGHEGVVMKFSFMTKAFTHST